MARSHAATVTANFSSASTIPVTASSYAAKGNNVDLSLGFAPAAGSDLTVVKNTGLPFIAGQFGNLRQGQEIGLNYGGIIYNFVANYFGGSGNDLVLVWQRRAVFSWGDDSATLRHLPVAVSSTGVLAGKTVIALAGGKHHSVVLCSDGTAAAWGLNSYGQLGNGSTLESKAPVRVDCTGVLLGRRVVSVSAGKFHNLALCSDGSIAAWGSNSHGQLGNRGTTDKMVPEAVDTSGILSGKKVVAVSAGGSHNLALCSDGTLVAWGLNSNGQLGNNRKDDKSSPVRVDFQGVLLGKQVVAISAGANFSLALCSDGSIASWGDNALGQLGDGSFVDRPAPVWVRSRVLAQKRVAAISAGTSHSLALCSDGTPVAWGSNENGQLGNGGNANTNFAILVDSSGVLAGKRITAVSAGSSFSLAVCANGEVAAWGTNESGELGDNGMTSRSVPGLIDSSSLGGAKAKAINAGFSHGLLVAALPPGNELQSLAVSSGSLTPPFSPEITGYRMKVAAGISSISFTPTARDASSITINGTPVVSGTAEEITLHGGFNPVSIKLVGDAGETRVYTIMVIVGSAVNVRFDSPNDVPVPAGEVDFRGLDASFSLGFAPATGAELTIVRNEGLPFFPSEFDNLPQGGKVGLNYRGITYPFVANYHGGSGNDLVLQWAYQDLCSWGLGADNRLGNPDSHSTGIPTSISNTSILAGKSLVDLSAGAMHTLALGSDGSLIGWGSNSQGELVNGNIGFNFPPRLIAAEGALAGKNVVAVSAGLRHSLALCADGTVAAWGAGAEGQLGNNRVAASGLPVAVDLSGVLAGKQIVAISAGATHNLALCGDGTVVAWGSNEYGKLGNGLTVNSAVPIAVAKTGALAGKSVIAVNAAYSHSSVLCSDGTVVTWGRNSSGQLGNGQTVDSLQPVQVAATGVLAGKTITQISGKDDFTLALCSDGTLAAWGNNTLGTLGDGTTTIRNAPVQVTRDGALAGKTIRSLNAGYGSATATCTDGTLVTWGNNSYGELGAVTDTWQSLVPLVVNPRGDIAGRKVLEAQAGSNFSLGLVAVPLSPDSKLAGLSVSPGVMDYALTASLKDYHLSVPQGTTSVTVTPAARQALAKITVNGTAVASGTGISIPLVNGAAVADLLVTAEDGTSSNYSVTVSSGHNITRAYNSPTDLAAEDFAFDATGVTANLTLGFAPATGTELLVVNNTGLSFIRGEFSNLSQGQEIGLNYNGIIYRFIADYHGGTGNDLVLRWLRLGMSVWGDNSNGELLDGGKPFGRKSPFNVLPVGALVGKIPLSVSVSGAHGLAVCSDGTVAAWGSNNGQLLGDGTSTPRDTPVVANPLGLLTGKKVFAVSAGGSRSLALCSDGTVVQWGTSTGEISSSGVLAGKAVVALATGSSHYLVLCSDGTVAAWGANTNGQLGNGSGPSTSTLPVAVNASGALAGKIVVSISAGNNSSYALCSDGSVVAWGQNTSGQLGNNSTANAFVPVAVDTTGALSSRKVVSISAGGDFGLALCSDGTIVSWGANGLGQLGNGTKTTSSIPVLVNAAGVLAGKSVTSLSAGGAHGMALCSDGTLAAWGNNSSGELGRVSPTSSSVPLDLTGSGQLAGRRVCFIEAGAGWSTVLAAIPAESSLTALVPDSGMLSPAFSPTLFGYSMVLDAGTTSLALTPTARDASLVKVNGSKVVSGTSSGSIPLHNGLNRFNIEVSGSQGEVSTYVVSFIVGTAADVVFNSADDVPINATNLDPTGISITPSLAFAPAVGTNLTLIRNGGMKFLKGQFSNLAHGQAVNLSFQGKTYPFVANYYGGSGNDLVLEWAIRSIAGWGSGNSGQLGVTASTYVRAPVAMDDMGILSGKTVVSIAAGAIHSLALCADGTVATWGSGANYLGAGGTSQSRRPIGVKTSGALAGKTVAGISAAAGNNLAVCSDGTVVAWGDGTYGQLGNGGNVASNEPVAVPLTGPLAGKSVVSVAVGGIFSLAVCTDGSVLAWGRNDSGQLGDGTTTNRNLPVLVSTSGVLAGKQVVAVSAGFEFSLALCSDGTLAAWGKNDYRQLGTSSGESYSAFPRLVDRSGVLAGETVVALSPASFATPTLLCASGKMVSWGRNDSGQRGTTSAVFPEKPDYVLATGVLAGKSVVNVSSGGDSSIATCSDGTVVTWGNNSYGQLGVPGITGTSPVPVKVTDNGVFTGKKALFAAEAFHSLVILAEPADGYFGWAFNHFGLADKSAVSDPDHDGIPNLLEYVLRGDPSIASNAILPTISASGSDFVFNFNRLATSAGDSTQVFQYSADMTQWTGVKITTPVDAGIAFGAVNSNGSQSVSVTVPKGAGTRMFGRLQVVRP